MKTVVIVGSSRNDGDTTALTDELIQKSKWDLIDLYQHSFQPPHIKLFLVKFLFYKNQSCTHLQPMPSPPSPTLPAIT
jgi:hypothetical protein